MATQPVTEDQVVAPPGAGAVAQDEPLAPSPGAAALSGGLLVGAILLAALVEAGDGFTPRVPSIDAIAGLMVGAFAVDRLLTFAWVFGADDRPKQREMDLATLRVGYGAAIGALFVVLTDLRAVQALTGDENVVSAEVDRAIAVLAIAGGVAGLARILDGINPKPATDGDTNTPTAEGTLPPPSNDARRLGLALVVLAAAGAYGVTLAMTDQDGINLLGPDPDADGSLGIVIRLGLVLLAAGIVQQLVEFASHYAPLARENRPVILGGIAVVLGVVAARLLDLYLMHNLGFFATGDDLNAAIAASSGAELAFDTFVTGLVIAAGTKPIHDISSRLRKAKEQAQAT